MVEYNVKFDNSLCTSLLMACLDAKDHTATNAILSYIERNSNKINPDQALHTVMIKCLSAIGHHNRAFLLWNSVSTSQTPDAQLYCSILNVCTAANNVGMGKAIYKSICTSAVLRNPESNMIVSSALITMFAKFQNMEEAQRISSIIFVASPRPSPHSLFFDADIDIRPNEKERCICLFYYDGCISRVI